MKKGLFFVLVAMLVLPMAATAADLEVGEPSSPIALETVHAKIMRVWFDIGHDGSLKATVDYIAVRFPKIHCGDMVFESMADAREKGAELERCSAVGMPEPGINPIEKAHLAASDDALFRVLFQAMRSGRPIELRIEQLLGGRVIRGFGVSAFDLKPNLGRKTRGRRGGHGRGKGRSGGPGMGRSGGRGMGVSGGRGWQGRPAGGPVRIDQPPSR